MILTTKARSAVMAMLDITIYGTQKPVSISDIAKRQELDPGYLEQIFIKLKNAGLVASFRGPYGGYKLCNNADDIKISTIMLAVDEAAKATRCTSHEGCMKDKSVCISHKLWSDLEDTIMAYFSAITLGSICNNSCASKTIDLHHKS